ncbi:Myo-inositol-1-phosphate synthase [Polystyrenella longa]|uniref:Myo-inositol-1-phosphate synthase n=1 Tax=Polystyrenella longa TaxID=2528007 RepID=A0A518CRP0_9PLAN|nr:inositol-3-phosphate synthase [Polystyrenella longa]QDU81878.1 Myo-inositol-1-phosphate synthase [Polystyrenella longa]
MSDQKIGIWLIGAWGGVATTTVTGLAALQQGLTPEYGLVSALPQFQNVGLADWSQFVVGGHEIRDTSYVEAAQHLHQNSRVFDAATLDKIEGTLKEFDSNVRPGTLMNVGPTITSLATGDVLNHKDETTSQTLERLKQDLVHFQKKNDLAHVVVMNVSSTEPPQTEEIKSLSWSDLEAKIGAGDFAIPASTLYAIAALQAGCSHVNFTPSIGCDLPALEDLSQQTGTLHVGRDGKTGETLMKSILAPMFANRNLNVMSWVGHNIFGNLDGKVLDDPVNKSNKVHSKDHLLTEILGYKPQTLVSIEYIESMGDWKTAWDHIHFQGFLGTPMVMQFTWQGCDSLLAAPLVLDLIRFTERQWRRGDQSGTMGFLSSFFKSPMGTDLPQFHKQFDLLEAWAEEVSAE